ncbi:MAG: DUF4276 family protein [Caldilineaceae bacterium]|nr:DUF4276 family protein [Caldilineaceae bacterium]
MKIQSIVEGHGEVDAVPILLRRLQEAAGAYSITIGRPIRRHSSDLNSRDRFQNAVRLALLQDECSAVLILFDCEDDCPKTKAAELTAWAQEVSGATPCEVVLAYREYESWFLAALESLRGKSAISETAQPPDEPEARRNAKGALEEWMPHTHSYSETLDQPGLTAAFDLALAYQRSRSFRRMVSAFGRHVRALGLTLDEWPPSAWLAE